MRSVRNGGVGEKSQMASNIVEYQVVLAAQPMCRAEPLGGQGVFGGWRAAFRTPLEATGQPGTAKTKRRPSTPRCPPLKGTAPLVNVEVVVLPATAVVSKAITTSTKSFWVSNPLLPSQGVLLTPSPR